MIYNGYIAILLWLLLLPIIKNETKDHIYQKEKIKKAKQHFINND